MSDVAPGGVWRCSGCGGWGRLSSFGMVSSSLDLLGCQRAQFCLEPARLPPIEGLVGFYDVGHRFNLGQDLHRIDYAAAHQFYQMRHVSAVVAVADRQVAVHRLADWK